LFESHVLSPVIFLVIYSAEFISSNNESLIATTNLQPRSQALDTVGSVGDYPVYQTNNQHAEGRGNDGEICICQRTFKRLLKYLNKNLSNPDCQEDYDQKWGANMTTKEFAAQVSYDIHVSPKTNTLVHLGTRVSHLLAKALHTPAVPPGIPAALGGHSIRRS